MLRRDWIIVEGDYQRRVRANHLSDSLSEPLSAAIL